MYNKPTNSYKLTRLYFFTPLSTLSYRYYMYDQKYNGRYIHYHCIALFNQIILSLKNVLSSTMIAHHFHARESWKALSIIYLTQVVHTVF